MFCFAVYRKTEENNTTLYSDTLDSTETQASDTVPLVGLDSRCNPEIAHYTIHIGKFLFYISLVYLSCKYEVSRAVLTRSMV